MDNCSAIIGTTGESTLYKTNSGDYTILSTSIKKYNIFDNLNVDGENKENNIYGIAVYSSKDTTFNDINIYNFNYINNYMAFQAQAISDSTLNNMKIYNN